MSVIALHVWRDTRRDGRCKDFDAAAADRDEKGKIPSSGRNAKLFRFDCHCARLAPVTATRIAISSAAIEYRGRLYAPHHSFGLVFSHCFASRQCISAGLCDPKSILIVNRAVAAVKLFTLNDTREDSINRRALLAVVPALISSQCTIFLIQFSFRLRTCTKLCKTVFRST